MAGIGQDRAVAPVGGENFAQRGKIGWHEALPESGLSILKREADHAISEGVEVQFQRVREHRQGSHPKNVQGGLGIHPFGEIGRFGIFTVRRIIERRLSRLDLRLQLDKSLRPGRIEGANERSSVLQEIRRIHTVAAPLTITRSSRRFRRREMLREIVDYIGRLRAPPKLLLRFEVHAGHEMDELILGIER